MTTAVPNYDLKFYELLMGNLSIEDFEDFVYSDTNLEKQLREGIYLQLISFDFKDKFAKEKLINLIKTKIIQDGKFETWKLKTILNDFLNQPERIDINLDKLYNLYCGKYEENKARKYEYKFLGNLGLNYLFWANESYLQTNYGDNWRTEYNIQKTEFDFYHKQLQNFATEILSAIESKEIEILDDGTYRISTELKHKLETDKIYELKHPNKK